MKITPGAVIGRTYGALTVLDVAPNTRDGRRRWRCKCTCGAEVVVANSNLRRRGANPVCSKQHFARLLIGRRFGKLIVTSLSPYRSARPGVIVCAVCDCGGIWSGAAIALRRGHAKSCGCLPCGIKPSPDRTVQMAKYVYKNYTRDAKRRGLAWALSARAFAVLISSNCHYCGSSPATQFDDKFDSRLYYNGIDRIDPMRGYVVDNVVSCCKLCNYAKHTLSKEKFLVHIRKIYEYSLRSTQ